MPPQVGGTSSSWGTAERPADRFDRRYDAPSARAGKETRERAADVCEIGDVTQATATTARMLDYAGIWALDLSSSEGLPALWWNASEITLAVTQDAEHLTTDLKVIGSTDTSAYEVLSYRVDGKPRTIPARGDATINFGLRHADGGKVLLLRSIVTSVVQEVELVHEQTERWELTDGGRGLVVCRILEGPLTRTVSRLVFQRSEVPQPGARR
jgi:hypothetical protein